MWDGRRRSCRSQAGGRRKIEIRREGGEGFLGGRAARGVRALFVGPQEAGDFGAEQLDEGAGQHLLVLLCVLEVVLGVCQHVKERFDQLLVLELSKADVNPNTGPSTQLLQPHNTPSTAPNPSDAPCSPQQHQAVELIGAVLTLRISWWFSEAYSLPSRTMSSTSCS